MGVCGCLSHSPARGEAALGGEGEGVPGGTAPLPSPERPGSVSVRKFSPALENSSPSSPESRRPPHLPSPPPSPQPFPEEPRTVRNDWPAGSPPTRARLLPGGAAPPRGALGASGHGCTLGPPAGGTASLETPLARPPLRLLTGRADTSSGLERTRSFLRSFAVGPGARRSQTAAHCLLERHADRRPALRRRGPWTLPSHPRTSIGSAPQ